jgi:subfamily B ATP-binding cassette protein MsbA
MNSKDLYLRLLGYVKPYWKVFLASILSTVLVAATEPAFPALLKPMLDGSFVNKDPTWIKLVPLLLVAIFLVRGMATFISSYSMSWVANKVVFDLRGDMFRRLINLPTSYFENNSSGALISKVSYDVSQVTGAATSALTVLVGDSLTILGLLAWLIYLNWKLSLIALAVMPAILLSITLFSKRLRKMSRGTQRANGEVIHVLEESIECHKVVKILAGRNMNPTVLAK